MKIEKLVLITLCCCLLTFLCQSQSKLDENIVKATSTNNLEGVQKNLAKGASIHALNQAGESLLTIAVKNENLQLVEFLLEKGCDVNRKDWRGRTSLLAATCYGNIDIVNLLYQKGAIGGVGISPTDYTCYGYDQIVKGMSLSELKKIVGGLGLLSEQSLIGLMSDGKPMSLTNTVGSFVFERGLLTNWELIHCPKGINYIKDVPEMPVILSANELIDNYITALGGIEKIVSITTLDQTYSMDLEGISIAIHIAQDKGKFHRSLTAPGMNILRQVYDGEKGQMDQMGQSSPIEGLDLSSLKEQAIIFPERLYKTEEYRTEIKGMAKVNGILTFKLFVTHPSGLKSTEYYDKDTYLKILEFRIVETQGKRMQTMKIFEDYKEIDGIKIPQTITVNSAEDKPMIMKVINIKINDSINPLLFKI